MDFACLFYCVFLNVVEGCYGNFVGELMDSGGGDEVAPPLPEYEGFVAVGFGWLSVGYVNLFFPCN